MASFASPSLDSFLPKAWSPKHGLVQSASPLRRIAVRSALREWKDYEEAVKRKDLAGALSFLKKSKEEAELAPLQPLNGSSSSKLGLFEAERDWQVLDTCLNADDLRLVANAYAFLKDRGFLPNFGKFRNIGNALMNIYILISWTQYSDLITN